MSYFSELDITIQQWLGKNYPKHAPACPTCGLQTAIIAFSAPRSLRVQCQNEACESAYVPLDHRVSFKKIEDSQELGEFTKLLEGAINDGTPLQ